MTDKERTEKLLDVHRRRIENLESLFQAQQRQLKILARLAGLKVDDENAPQTAALHTLN